MMRAMLPAIVMLTCGASPAAAPESVSAYRSADEAFCHVYRVFIAPDWGDQPGADRYCAERGF